MTSKLEQFNALQRKNMEAATRLAQMSIENSQRILALQTDLAKSLFQHGVENAKAQAGVRDPKEAAQLVKSYTEETTQQMMAVAQQIAEIGNQARTEITRLVTEQLATGSQDLSGAMQEFFKGLPAQNPQLMEGFQQAITTATAAFEQVAQASAAAMGNASEAVKKAAARKK
ncbi:MAG: phasin protein [Betaproteobacteria bacterium HGW-Betaproteobacteria-11]|nr:MAG: phasin protein [Betaproteobacteria bacterium HGW-Betaproteobacteria-11]